MTKHQFTQRFMFKLEDDYNNWGREKYGNWNDFVSAMYKRFNTED